MAREFKDSGIEWIGQIPKEWKVELIGNNIKEINDKNDDSSEDNALQFKMGTIISKKGGDSKYNPESLVAYTKVKEGDIVINGLNLSFDFISQRVGLVREKGVITSTYLTLRPSSLLYSRFVNYLFKAYDNCKAFHGMGRGLRQILAYRELKNQKLIYPALPEQQKIADYLDKVCGEVDEMVALQEKMIEELKAYKQSVITEAVTKGLNPNVPMKDSGIDWIGEIPEHWSVDKVVRLFRTIGSGTTPNSSDNDAFHGTINWIQSGDINGGVLRNSKNKISEETLAKYSVLTVYKAPFIIVAMYGASVGNISISQIDGCVNQACCVLSDSNINFLYAFYAIKAAQRYLIYRAVGGGQPNISQNTLKHLWIAKPPIEEQQQIASYLDTKCSEIDSLIAIKQQKIEELKEYKKSIIYEYVTGKKEVA